MSIKFLSVWLLAGMSCWLSGSSAWALTEADWLYAVERPVAAQTDAERDRAASEGLLVVLSRLTGLTSVPRGPEITAALARPGAYYNRFVFFSRRDELEEQRYVRVTFQADAVQGLVKAAGLPVWWSKRPNLLAWIVADGPAGREILSSGSAHPLVAPLQARARERGVSMTLPLMDLDDSLAVTPADVWGKLRPSLDAGAARYGAELVLIGRVSHSQATFTGDTPYRGDWEVWVDGRPLAENFAALGAEDAANLGVDMIADHLAAQFAVLPRPQQLQVLSISGLRDSAGYAEFMRYLASLEFIDRVDIKAIDAATLHITLASRAEMDQLMMLLTAEGRLAPDSLHRGLGTQLIWQG